RPRRQATQHSRPVVSGLNTQTSQAMSPYLPTRVSRAPLATTAASTRGSRSFIRSPDGRAWPLPRSLTVCPAGDKPRRPFDGRTLKHNRCRTGPVLGAGGAAQQRDTRMNVDHSERRLPRTAMVLLLAGGRASRPQHLSDIRCKPAVYFGGKFRIIDFALSNCMTSGLRKIGVLTQYKSHSLLRHLQRGWSFLKPEMGEFIDLLPAQQRIDETSWYRGTSDAVYQNLDIVRANDPEYIVVLAGDHVYKMDYARMLADHVTSRADCTVGCIEVPRMDATGFGVMHIDESRRVLEFIEKPADPPPIPGRPDV